MSTKRHLRRPLPIDLLPCRSQATVQTVSRMNYSRVNIEEANKHLKQLHQRVVELENQVQMQSIHADELQKSNLELQQRLKESDAEKNARISELTEKLQQSERQVQQLLEAAEERDTAVLKLEKKARLFYEVVEHKSALARILQVMEELSVVQEGDPDGTVHESSISLRNGSVPHLQRESGDFEELSSPSCSSTKLAEESDSGANSPLPTATLTNDASHT